VKAFFEHWMLRDEISELPMPRPRAVTPGAFTPYIYSVFDLRKLLRCALSERRASCDEIDSYTLRTVLRFLYGTGARINEALAMTPVDVDLKKGLVTLHPPRANTTRTVPVGPSLLRLLRLYSKSTMPNRCEIQSFFTRRDGRPICDQALTRAFQRLRHRAGISRSDGICRKPQMRDLRYTFAVHCLRAWLKEGRDPRSMLPVLGAYMGHVSLSSSEVYLAVTPERFWTQLSRLSHRTHGVSYPERQSALVIQPGEGVAYERRSKHQG
jgi:integrase/recombinase XerD